MSKCGFGFSFDMELEEPLDFFDVVYKNGENVRYEKRPHEEWETCIDPEYCKCSYCGNVVMLEESVRFHFCPNCGADMRKREDEQK